VIATTIGRTVTAGTRYLADVTISSTGITGWLKDNALPLIIFVIGLGLLGASRKGDTSKVLLTVALVIVSLAVVTIGLDTTLGLGIGKWLLSLLGVQNTPTAPTAPPATPGGAVPTTGGG
jgi:predicted permease